MTNEKTQTDNFPSFSLFRAPIKKTLPKQSINILDLHKMITTDKNLEDLTNVISNINDKKQRDKVKAENLQSVTPSGVFRSRCKENIVYHSGYLCIDLDNLNAEEMIDIKNNLLTEKYIETALLFISPSKNGYKWFIKIPDQITTHTEYFLAVENYLLKTYGYKIDENCKDYSRACFLSYDENAYLNTDVVKGLDDNFLESWGVKEKRNSIKPVANNSDDKKLSDVRLLLAKIEESNIVITDNYQDWLKIGFALCELEETGRDFFHAISKHSDKYDERECDEKFTNLLETYNGDIKLNTLFFIAAKNGVTINSEKPEVILNDNTAAIIKKLPRTAHQRMEDAKNQLPIKKLVGTLWFSGELHILFGDNGTGKSIWATQIADALTKGKSVMDILPNETEPQKVLFYDFELSDKQFELRYTDEYGVPYKFSQNFHIDNIDFRALAEEHIGVSPDEMILKKIEQSIIELQPQVLIIDNLTYLKTETTQDAKVALEILRKLNQLKTKYELSILVLAHTPKIKSGQPITNNDLAGSKQLSNFADSISAIGKSYNGKQEKYIKQIKCRSSSILFDIENVISTKLNKDGSFLGFEMLACENEYEHLTDASIKNKQIEKENKKEQAINLNNDGLSLREIEEQIGIGKSTIQRWLKEEAI